MILGKRSRDWRREEILLLLLLLRRRLKGLSWHDNMRNPSYALLTSPSSWRKSGALIRLWRIICYSSYESWVRWMYTTRSLTSRFWWLMSRLRFRGMSWRSSSIRYQNIRRRWSSIIKHLLGLKESREDKVVLHHFGYQITLAHFKVRYPKLELKKDSFTDYPED